MLDPVTDGEKCPGLPSLGWLRATLPVALIAVCAELGYAVLSNSALPVYFTHGLGLDTALLTAVMTPFFISEAVGKGPLGVLADHYGRKPLMIFGPAVSIFTPLLIIALHPRADHVSVAMLVVFGILRLLDGLGAASLWPAMFAYVADKVEEAQRSKAMGALNVTYMIGLAFGFLAGGYVNDTFGPVLSGEQSLRHQVRIAIRNMRFHHHHMNAALIPNISSAIFNPARYYPSFYLASALFAVATVIAVVALNDNHRPARSAGAAGGQSEALTWRSFVDAVRTVPGLMVLAFTAFLGIGCIALLVKLFALDEFGISETEFGLLILWPAVVIGLLAIPLGHLSDQWGRARSVRLGFALTAIGMWTMIFLYRVPALRDIVLILAGSALGIGFVIAFPAWIALLTSTGDAMRRGTLLGAVASAQGVGMLCGAAIGTTLYSHGSANVATAHIMPFYVSAIMLSLSTLLAFVLVHDPRPTVRAVT